MPRRTGRQRAPQASPARGAAKQGSRGAERTGVAGEGPPSPRTTNRAGRARRPPPRVADAARAGCGGSSHPPEARVVTGPRRPAGPAIRRAHETMSAFYGPLRWWPAETPFEVALGAILTQNTAWRRVEAAIAGLRSHGLLEARTLATVPEGALAEHLRPAGTFRVKARYVRAFLEWLLGRYGGDLGAALRGDSAAKREELLALRGIGRETADSILLYAGGHPVFVVDAYTRRIFSRHGVVGGREDYDEIRRLFEAALPRDAAVYNELHAQIVMTGKDFCRPRSPRCESCPLSVLPFAASAPAAPGRPPQRRSR